MSWGKPGGNLSKASNDSRDSSSSSTPTSAAAAMVAQLQLPGG